MSFDALTFVFDMQISTVVEKIQFNHSGTWKHLKKKLYISPSLIIRTAAPTTQTPSSILNSILCSFFGVLKH